MLHDTLSTMSNNKDSKSNNTYSNRSSDEESEAT